MNFLRSLFRENLRWALHCPDLNWTMHDLSTREAQVLIESLRDYQREGVLAWRAGFVDWKLISDPGCRKLLDTRIFRIEAPALPKTQTFDDEITAVKPLSQVQSNVTRKHQRFPVVVPLEVLSGTHVFRTESVDLSEGGIRVKDNLPDWVAGYSSVILDLGEIGRIELMCSLAEDQKQSKTRFEIVTTEQTASYVLWLQEKTKDL